jgi:hypothetical protein
VFSVKDERRPKKQFLFLRQCLVLSEVRAEDEETVFIIEKTSRSEVRAESEETNFFACLRNNFEKPLLAS